MNDRDYSYLSKTILRLVNIDLKDYKSHQMRRRLEGYLVRIKARDVVEFCTSLEKAEEARRQLREFLTINVSEFFRDSQQWEVLRSQVLPKLLGRSRTLNIWSAGCSLGQEPYSVALTLEAIAPRQSYRILATDLDEAVLERAIAGGPYPSSAVRNVPRPLLSKYFHSSPEEYWISEELRRRVEFRQQNLLIGTFEGGMDLVIYRNVCIYFSDQARGRLFESLCRCLRDCGWLFMGGTETLLDAGALGMQHRYYCFYEKEKPASSIAGRAKVTTLASA